MYRRRPVNNFRVEKRLFNRRAPARKIVIHIIHRVIDEGYSQIALFV